MILKHYLNKLINEAHEWQNTDINGNLIPCRWFFLPIQWIFIFLSILITILIITEGLNKDFIGYIIAALSIFIGLFVSIILSLNDRFYPLLIESLNRKLTDKEKINLIRKKNYIKQFTSLTTYSILLAILCIILLSLSLVIGSFRIHISLNTLTESFEIHKYYIFCKYLLIIVYRIIVLYFLFDFILITVYAITSMYNYIIVEYDKIEINDT